MSLLKYLKSRKSVLKAEAAQVGISQRSLFKVRHNIRVLDKLPRMHAIIALENLGWIRLEHNRSFLLAFGRAMHSTVKRLDIRYQPLHGGIIAVDRDIYHRALNSNVMPAL